MVTVQYQERFVAFVDIWGFGDLVRRSVLGNDGISASTVHDVLDLPKPSDEDQIVLGRIGDISKSGHCMTAFSDCVVISTDLTEAGLIHLVDHVSRIGFRLLKIGYLYRGGVVRGLLWHQPDKVFGPALIEAYQIERTERFLRVLVSDDVVKWGLGCAKPVNTIFSRLIRKDDDGKYMVHVLRYFSQFDDLTNLRDKISEVRDRFEKKLTRLTQNQMAEAAGKVSWFLRYFDRITIRPNLNVPFPAVRPLKATDAR